MMGKSRDRTSIASFSVMGEEHSFDQHPPECPSGWVIPYPSVVTLFSVTCLLSLLLALVCVRSFYKSVSLVSVKLRTTQFSVTAWVIYFLCVSVK